MKKIPLTVIIRNFELRLVERIPVDDPMKGVHLTKSSWEVKEFATLLHGTPFKNDIREAKKEHNLTKAFMTKVAFDKIDKDVQHIIKTAMEEVDLEFIAIEGHPFFGGGGLYNHSITFT